MKSNSEAPRRAQHPLHPFLAHFPMGLLMISSLWDLLGLWQGESMWWNFAFWSITVGLIFAVLAVFAGIMDYVKIPQGGPAEQTAMRHMMIMIVAVLLYTGSFMVRYREVVVTGNMLVIAVALSVAGLIVLLVGGWHGGELVYRHGVGSSDRQIQIQEEQH